ncbi:glucuronate isomerase [Alginatibacterium sediminis]|uniref:Uronate isomerase n=1 Tax=Alginatibacterium sediminis TaxID=2164068 RepID=A0A420EHC9_9ALTE|nr:glucuronate isomerase [Alginatibacterium sediminis]RKF20067.1 glucuronate isomerase [Alginatibacterium sediminis]
MKNFMCDDFLLSTETARRLYHDYAAQLPIFDYHCHLNPSDIAKDRRFDNLSQIWLEGDHYKWRALRSAGIEEQLITGSASDFDKYIAWSKTVPMCLGNPLYHWTHLELRRPFGIQGKLFNPDTATEIWEQGNALLATPEFSARGIMKQMNVEFVGTTDDPIDSLEHHKSIALDSSFDISVAPSWRPDKAFKIELPGFVDYIANLEQVSDLSISSFSQLQDALMKRLDHFDAHGCLAADHGIEILRFANIPSEQVLDGILLKGLTKQTTLSELEIAQFGSAVQVWLATEYHRRNWVMQLHIGAQRNNSSRMFKLLGPDSGYDSIGDRNIAQPLGLLLDAIDSTNSLPKTILYCLNPNDNEVLATMVGNFQGGGMAGKIQFGSGWWFNDQKDGMIRQLTQLSQLGLISQFVGMLTDSRSLLSYTRHEYFRRILCEMIGSWVENGEAPNDLNMMGQLVSDICVKNARRYFKT